MKFLNADPSLKINGVAGRKSVFSYLLSGSNEKNRIRNPYEYRRVECTNLFPMINLVFYKCENELEFDYLFVSGTKFDLNFSMKYTY